MTELMAYLSFGIGITTGYMLKVFIDRIYAK